MPLISADNIICVLCVAVIVLCFVKMFQTTTTVPLYKIDSMYSPYCNVSDIPQYLKHTSSTKVIWSYWHSSNLPNSVCLAFQTWKYHQPDFIICLLSEETLPLFVDTTEISHAKSHHEKSDMLRLALLEKYGGYWVDSSIYFQKPIANLWEPKDYDIGGFTIDGFTTDPTHKVFESWFIVAPKHSPLIREWKREFFEALKFKSRQEYIDKIKQDGVDLQKVEDQRYLMIHCCFLKIIRGDHPYHMKTISALDPSHGPLHYLTQHNWYPHTAVWDLLKNDNSHCRQSMLKLRGPERTFLDILWNVCQPHSTIGKLKSQTGWGCWTTKDMDRKCFSLGNVTMVSTSR